MYHLKWPRKHYFEAYFLHHQLHGLAIGVSMNETRREHLFQYYCIHVSLAEMLKISLFIKDKINTQEHNLNDWRAAVKLSTEMINSEHILPQDTTWSHPLHMSERVRGRKTKASGFFEDIDVCFFTGMFGIIYCNRFKRKKMKAKCMWGIQKKYVLYLMSYYWNKLQNRKQDTIVCRGCDLEKAFIWYSP